MDAAGIITGAIVALAAGVLIPFLTTQFSLWSEDRRKRADARRADYVALLEARYYVDKHSNGSNVSTMNVAGIRLRAAMAPGDQYVSKCVGRSMMGDTDAQRILGLWVNGYRFRARKQARALTDVTKTP